MKRNRCYSPGILPSLYIIMALTTISSISSSHPDNSKYAIRFLSIQHNSLYNKLMSYEDEKFTLIDSVLILPSGSVNYAQWVGNDRIVYASRRSTAFWGDGDYNVLLNYKEKVADTLVEGVDHRYIDYNLVGLNNGNVAFYVEDDHILKLYTIKINRFKQTNEIELPENLNPMFLDPSISPNGNFFTAWSLTVDDNNPTPTNVFIDFAKDSLIYFNDKKGISGFQAVWDTDTSLYCEGPNSELIQFYVNGNSHAIEKLGQNEGNLADMAICGKYLCLITEAGTDDRDVYRYKILIFDIADNYRKKVIYDGNELTWGLEYNYFDNELLYIQKKDTKYHLYGYSFEDGGTRLVFSSDDFIDKPHVVEIE